MSLPRFLSTPRAAVMLVFAAFGATVGAFSGAIPALVRQTGISSELLGLALTGLTLANVVVFALGGMAARHFSNRIMLLLAMPLLALSLAIMLTAKSAALLFAAMLAHGLVIGLTDLIMNAEGSAVENDLRRPVFTAFHGAVSISIAFFAIFSSWLAARFGPVAVAGAASFVCALAWLAVFANVPARPLQTVTQRRAASVVTAPLILMGIIAGLAIACETSAMFWSAKLLDETAPQLAAITGLGVAFFGLCNAMVRFPGDALRAKFGDFRLMTASSLLAIAGFVSLSLSPSFAFSVFSFALVGLGTAIICPCIYNMAAAQIPSNRAAGLGFALLVAGAPRIAMPAIFGALSGAFSTKAAFGLCAGLMCAALLLMTALRSQPRLGA
jgi:MFS family permease